MKVLELFCGTKSIGNVCREKGWDVISVDCDEKCNPTICCDIKDFDYKQYKRNYFDIIWASPPCQYFSTMRKAFMGRYLKKHNGILTPELWKKDIEEEGLPPLRKTFDIINYLKPKYWFIENPQSGEMKQHITNKRFIDVDYCRFGFDYKKRTRIWNNRRCLKNQLCLGENNCESMTGKKHNVWLGMNDPTNLNQRYRVPVGLVNYLMNGI